MEFNEYQSKTSETAIYPREDTYLDPETDNLIRKFITVLEPLNVITNALKKTIRDDKGRMKLHRYNELRNAIVMCCRRLDLMNNEGINVNAKDNMWTGANISQLYTSLGIVDESLEVFTKVNSKRNCDVEELQKEIGDVLWYTSQLSSELSSDLSEIAEYNIKKLANRKDRNKLSGDGDNR